MTVADEVTYSADEMMVVAASRMLASARCCLVGIGVPGAAACLAQAMGAPDLVLMYESGCIGSRPTRVPLTIGDGELSATALTVVSLPEIFAYWIQAGRIDVGLVGAAQVDRYANINSTVVGSYERPKVRLPGAGGAPEIVGSCGQILIMVRQNPRTLVERLDFRTSVGFGAGPGDRRRLGLIGGGPSAVITDLGVLRPDPDTCELVLTQLHPGVTVEQALDQTGWTLRVAASLSVTAPPTHQELYHLRRLGGV